jgi:hypothetical protein
MPSGYPGASDNASINSSKSKNSKLPRKKRTIDHHHHNSSRHHHNFGASEPMDDHQDQHSRRSHRRNFSSASTASTLSEGGLSLNSSALDKGTFLFCGIHGILLCFSFLLTIHV